MDHRSGRALAAAAGATLAAFGIYALVSIPRSAHEFRYEPPSGGSAFWPLPFAPLNGFTPEQLSSHFARGLFLFPACLLIGAAFPTLGRRTSMPAAGTSLVVGCLLSAAIALFVVRGVPLQDDDATYLMQADLLRRGLVADPGYSPADAFPEPFTVFTNAGMSGMYLFGTPLVLALGLPFGAPWIGQIALVALTVWCAFYAAARSGYESIARGGALMLAVSPMLTFTSATMLSQPAALAGIAVAVCGFAVRGVRGGALVGTGLGFALAARPQAAGPAGLALIALYGWRDRRLLLGAMAAGLPWLLAVAVYNTAVTGSPVRLPRFAYAGELEQFGFGVVLRHYVHTPLKAMALAAVTLVRLNGWSLGWPLSLAGPALWCAIGGPHRRIVGPWAAVAAATFLYQAGYASVGTSETGAIYHYLALPFIAFATAAALHACSRRPWADWVRATAVVSLLVGTTSFYVEHAWRLSRLTSAIEGPRRRLDLQRPAVVLEETWGGRPQEGWVFGIPFRDRAPSSAVIRYPRPATSNELHRLIARWPDRHCSYLWYDWRAATYRLNPCSEIPHLNPGAEPQPAPWYENGGWRAAFPYLNLRSTGSSRN